MALTIYFIEPGGDVVAVETQPGITLMEVAMNHMVAGVDAECGGACACATCHVYVDPVWAAQIPERSQSELAMLEFAVGVRAESRLSCQIPITPGLDGLTVSMPQSQR